MHSCLPSQIHSGKLCVYQRQIQNGKPYVYNWQTDCGKLPDIGKFTVESCVSIIYHRQNSPLKLCVYHRQIENGTPCVYYRHIHCGKLGVYHRQIHCGKLCVYHRQIHNGKLCACHRQIHCGKSTIGKLIVGSLSSAYSLCGSWCLSIVNVLWEAVCLSLA